MHFLFLTPFGVDKIGKEDALGLFHHEENPACRSNSNLSVGGMWVFLRKKTEFEASIGDIHMLRYAV